MFKGICHVLVSVHFVIKQRYCSCYNIYLHVYVALLYHQNAFRMQYVSVFDIGNQNMTLYHLLTFSSLCNYNTYIYNDAATCRCFIHNSAN